MEAEQWGSFVESVGLTPKDGQKDRHPLLGKKAGAEVQEVCMLASRMAIGRWLVAATLAVGDMVLMGGRLGTVSGWIEAERVGEEVAVAAV